MTARIAKRRTKTGRELAEQFGVTRATVVRMMAEPREEFLAPRSGSSCHRRAPQAPGAHLRRDRRTDRLPSWDGSADSSTTPAATANGLKP
ncbi:hypothetical protein DMP14_06155 [Pseudonocardia sp. Ae707_Ps2]